MNCRICNNIVTEFLNLGKMPLANAFLQNIQNTDDEAIFPLALCFCNNCKLVQLSTTIPSEVLFSNYIYVSSTALSFRKHFENMATHLKDKLILNNNSLVVDIGSNDGILLREWQKINIKSIGIEPAKNIAKMANDEGLKTINSFFNKELVENIIKSYGQIDVITACNVFAHVRDIESVIKNVKSLLNENGTFVIEIQYFMDTVKTLTFDNVYHEHMYYYTITSLDNLFKKNNMQICRVEHVDTHGGSVRVYIKNNIKDIDESYYNYLNMEKKSGVDNISSYTSFANDVFDTKDKITSLIKKLKKEGKKIIGYGAPAKSNTLLNFCNLNKNDLDYIIDDNPLKQELYTPGTHIKVYPFSILKESNPDYILILAWNFAQVIIDKINKEYPNKFKFIIPLPKPKII